MLAHCCCLAVLVALLALPAVGEAQGQADFSPSPLRHVRVGDISVGYRTIGSGPPLVLITGYAATLYVWDPGLLMRLAEDRRVIVFDNRGVLTTSRGRGRLTIKRMADDTAGLIRALGYRSADVLGWSMGGYIAQELALRHPNRVRRLVLAATDPGSSRAIQPKSPLARRLLDDPNPTIQELLRAIFPATKQAAADAYSDGFCYGQGCSQATSTPHHRSRASKARPPEHPCSAAPAAPMDDFRVCERPHLLRTVAATFSSRRATRGSSPAASRARGSPYTAEPATPSFSSAASTSPSGSTPS
jgi:pimeloyl-ACP methyl ester carboxylesterase